MATCAIGAEFMTVEFRRELLSGRFLLGSWVSSSDPAITEAMTESGLSYVIIDAEHSPLGPDTVQMLMMAAKGSGTAVLVRVGGTDPIRLMQPLDAGADGIVVPRISSAREVRKVVESARYPPTGLRGYGPRRAGGYTRSEESYVETAERRVTVIVQIETKGAVAELPEIARVQGLDGLLVGRNDLAGALGVPGQPGHPMVTDVVLQVIEVCRDTGVAAGIACAPAAAEIQNWRDAGMNFVAAGMDIAFLVHAVDALVDDVRRTAGPVDPRSTVDVEGS
jgi:2-keto-3-deoxy-L-rhamnonate aldolase RhmA